MTNKHVLKKNWEFKAVLAARKQVVSKNLIIYYVPSEIFQVGISIPKQFANAVMRNHYRNQIRAIIRELDKTNILFRTIIIARKTFLSLDFKTKQQEIKNLYERIVKNGKRKV
ncbi:ribonuclease P protein component [Metamycoplasma arthritidis]|uniref:Ribonuclease P protein component n=1 Tax=Metamycoplasma arthritidis (strain 158L3-1) TaxID=243272 RepID=B3PNJ6_META1|nr:ribonuclease P protein component [Metamycoplasma arthritidis]ACF07598.1 ribonuclease P protein component [Metamycoplasma arthritidis 158L3-1]VEU79106.1 ribonuclease P protein component [Metamycoplasma arthritidis]